MKRGQQSGHAMSCFILLLLAGGCVANVYEVELTPRRGSMDRKLVFQRQRVQNDKVILESPEPEELTRLARAYGTEVPARESRRYEFRGKFAGRMPEDIGNSGAFVHWSTQFGSATVYVERFRGRDDLVADLETRRAALERCCDLITGWLESELATDPRFPRLHSFLAGDFRRDVQNVGLYLWLIAGHRNDALVADAGEGTLTRLGGSAPLLARLQGYLADRGYVTIEEYPELARGIGESTAQNPSRLLTWLRQQVAFRLGIAKGETLPASLDFLADQKRCVESLSRFLESTEEYRRLPRNADAKPEALDVLDAPLSVLVGDLVVFGADSLQVTLNLPAAPILSNGPWLAEKSAVQWAGHMPTADRTEPWPVTIYAIWCEPDEAEQTRTLGRTILRGEELLTYCFWRASLTEPEGRQWDDFLKQLTPGPTLRDALQAFRFPGEGDEGFRLSDVLREPILGPLR